MTPHNLPQHWQWVTLREISETISKGTTPTGGKHTYLSQGIAFLRAENILDNGEVDLSNAKFISKEQHTNQLKRSQLKNNDILITIAGTLGRSAILKTTQECNTNQAVSFIRLKQEFSPYANFIQKYLSSPNAYKTLINQAKTTAIPNLTLQIISDTKIPLPPLEIQREIVEILESKLEKIASAKALLESSLKKCETYRLSLLNDAFNGNLTPHSKVWQWVRLGECLEKMTTAKLDKDTFSYIDIESIDNKTQTITTPKTLPTSKAPSRAKREVKEGDTLFSMVRPYLKNIAFVDSEFNHCVASTGFYVCRPKSNLLPKYLFFLMISPLVVNGLNQFMRGDNSPSIRSHDLENFSIPLPPLEIQREIVEILESKLEKIASAKAILESSLKECETYRLSLLESAFEGS